MNGCYLLVLVAREGQSPLPTASGAFDASQFGSIHGELFVSYTVPSACLSYRCKQHSSTWGRFGDPVFFCMYSNHARIEYCKPPISCCGRKVGSRKSPDEVESVCGLLIRYTRVMFVMAFVLARMASNSSETSLISAEARGNVCS